MLASRIYALGILGFTLAWLVNDHYRPWTNFHSEALAFIGIWLLALSQLVNRRFSNASAPRLMVVVASMILIPWAQFFLGISFFAGDALISSLYLCGFLAAIFVGYTLSRSDAANLNCGFIWVMHGLWLAAMVSAAIGLLQWLNLQAYLSIYVVQTDFGDPAMANLAQPNQLATLLLLGIIACGYIFERRIIGGFTFSLSIFVMTAVLVLTHSRAGMLGVLAVGGFLFVKRSRMNARLRAGHIVAWLLFFVLATVASPSIDQALMLNVEREPLFTSGGRMLIWSQITQGIIQSPWLGYGWNQTAAAQMVGVVLYPGALPVSYAHSIILDMIVWNGVPLGLVLIGLGAYWFCTRIYRVAGLDAGYAMACLLPITVHSLVEFPFAYSYFLITAGLMMGVVEAYEIPVKVWRIHRFWLGAALAFWAIIGSYMIYEYFLIEEDFRVVRFELLRVGKTEATYQVPDIWMLSHMGTMLKAARQPAVPNMTAQQLNDLRQVSLRFPLNPVNLRYALALGLNGDPDGARHMMAVVRGMYGEKYYAAAKALWAENAVKYPQLRAINVP
ncbi:MAG: O-antigen ligase C-terminal domain-containing protein [Rhodoferax sp.]|jgi:O-antigen ligase|nr:O-antigen ligase C-terminal domain-containing protein [Rhodoferax sp.]